MARMFSPSSWSFGRSGSSRCFQARPSPMCNEGALFARGACSAHPVRCVPATRRARGNPVRARFEVAMLAASIVIPCHNKMATLPEVLAALERQNFPLDGFEVLVVDDGSTDGVRQFVQSFEGRLPRIVLEELGP